MTLLETVAERANARMHAVMQNPNALGGEAVGVDAAARLLSGFGLDAVEWGQFAMTQAHNTLVAIVSGHAQMDEALAGTLTRGLLLGLMIAEERAAVGS